MALSYSQFGLVSYLAPKTLGLEPHLDSFNLYNLAKMFSPTFLATIVSNVNIIVPQCIKLVRDYKLNQV